MSVMINEGCINCGICVRACPNKGIQRGEMSVVLDRSKCSECVGFYNAPRCVEVCPIEGLLTFDPNHRETEAALFARAQEVHARTDKQPKLSDKTSHFRSRTSRRWWEYLNPFTGRPPEERPDAG